MDNMTIIAVASIITAGITTGFGTMAPALGDSLLLRPEQCMHEQLGPWQLLGLRMQVYAAFYGARYLQQPGALPRLLVNVARGRQTNKLEAFAQSLLRRARLR